MDNNKYIYVKNGIINEWDSAIPLGNGCLGTLIYGSNPLIFYVDCNKIWDMRSDNTQLEVRYDALKEIVKEQDDDRLKQWKNKTNDKYCYPTKLPGFRILINTQEDVKEYSLDTSTAIATVKMKNEKLITAFVSVKENLGYILCSKEYMPNLQMPDFEKKKEKSYGQVESLADLGFKNGIVRNENNIYTVKQSTTTAYNYTFGYAIKQMGEQMLIIYGVEDSFENNSEQLLKERLLRAVKAEYLQTVKVHKRYSKRYFNKSFISIEEDKGLSDLWRLTDYYFGCCSKNNGNPIALQGVWTADNGELPPWKGDYHFDLNIEMSYWSYMQANHLDRGRSFVDFLWKNREKAKWLAENFYGGKGIALPGCADVNFAFIFGWLQYSVSLTSGCWACQAFAHYYEYSKSKTFLKNRAYPYFKETAKFILSMLEEQDGYLQLPLSSSPEIFDSGWEAWLPNNSAYDIALVRYVFETLIQYCKELNLSTIKWESVLQKLPPIPVSDGVIGICKDITLKESHRHLSHMIGIYPLKVVDVSNKKQREIAIKTMKDYLSLGTAWWVGYSFVWTSRICTELGLYKEAYKHLKIFQDAFVGENGFHLNGDFKDKGYSNLKYKPFTLEANFAYNDALQSLLLRVDNSGVVYILDGIPKKWQNLSFKLRCGTDIYECALKDGELISFIIYSKQAKEVEIKFPYFEGNSIFLNKGKNQIV